MIKIHNTAVTSTESVPCPASGNAVNSGSEDLRVAHILTSSGKAWLALMCLQEKHPPCSFNVSFQDALYQFTCTCRTLSFRKRAPVAFKKGWVGKECLRLRQVFPEVINFIQPSESVASSKYLLINWKKTLLLLHDRVGGQTTEGACQSATFPETEDLFWLKQPCMWWRNYPRVHSSDSKQTSHPASVVIHPLFSALIC